MPYEPDKHRRRSIRLPGYDYTETGIYHITLLVQGRRRLLSSVKGSEVILSPYGRIAEETWTWLAEHLGYVRIDTHVLMPDHQHVLMMVDQTVKTRKPLGGIIGMYKTVSTKAMNARDGTPGKQRWHRNYYEQIISNADSLGRVRAYIIANPQRWSEKRTKKE